MPQVHEIDGVPTWTMDGHTLARPARRRRRRRRHQGARHDVLPVEHRRRARSRVRRRRPPRHDGRAGHLGADRLPEHRRVRRAEVLHHRGRDVAAPLGELYNDAMAEMQDKSGGRLFPMAIVPWWDVDLAVVEIDRIAAPRTAWPQHHDRAARPRPARPRRRALEPDVGGGRGQRPADQLPHRCQRLVARVVRLGAVAVAERRPEARARVGDDVPRTTRG